MRFSSIERANERNKINVIFSKLNSKIVYSTFSKFSNILNNLIRCGLKHRIKIYCVVSKRLYWFEVYHMLSSIEIMKKNNETFLLFLTKLPSIWASTVVNIYIMTPRFMIMPANDRTSTVNEVIDSKYRFSRITKIRNILTVDSTSYSSMKITSII